MALQTGKRIEDLMKKVIVFLDRYAPFMVLGVVLVEIGMLAWYQFTVGRVSFNSDGAGVNLFAEEMLKAGSLFPKSWLYVDGLPVLQNQLYALFFLPFMANSFLLHAVAGIINCGALFLVLYWFTRKAGLGLFARLLVLSVVFSGISFFFSFNMFGHGYYGSMVTGYLLILGLVMAGLRLGEPSEEKHTSRRFQLFSLLSSALVFILTVLISLGGRRPVIVFTLPLIASLVLAVLLTRPEKKRIWSVLKYICILGAGTAIGYGLYSFLNNGLHLFLAKENEGFASAGNIITNLNMLFVGILDLVGARPGAQTAMVSLASIIFLCKFFIFGFIVILPVALVFSLQRLKSPHFKFLVIYTVVNLALTVYFLLFTRVIVDTSSLRYFIFQLVLHIIVAGWFFQECWLENKLLLQRTYLFPFLIIPLLSPLYLSSIDLYTNPRSQQVINEFGEEMAPTDANPMDSLASFLKQSDLRYGYATYWIAGATTILTDSHTKVRQIGLETGIPLPDLWLGSEDWYLPSAWQGSTCLIVTVEQLNTTVNKDDLALLLGVPQETKYVGRYIVYVYDYNIAEKLPW
ncbi:hypothetical protein AUK40_06810 [Candidatus Wirthbacteria bacterium CG2_30_54_11]|uniref:Glycosyltransferase RgtA/B/C/D-like domain-containing protein n=1 Tax=Candidatus Wirthbacteria bacterium CG2_30_54_11 TaxID=1817892 RepID=A0A1J5IBF5_9BACT|nr:MAG: hypothetical protein AUK40_06810 [Candidatus Wirthbacteria bacterium CG2_30_54_11]